jgi:hypothetical protein
VIARMGPLIIHYDVPGTSPHGQLLDEIVLHPTGATNGIGFVVGPAVTVSPQTNETVARATRSIAQTLGMHARSLTVRYTSHNRWRMPTGHDCSAEGDAVLDLTLDGRWTFNLWLALLRAHDLLSGRFPSMHATARVSWIDVLWTLSLEGRLAAREVVRPSAPKTAATTGSTDNRARNELLTMLIWAGKQRGLSLSMNDAARIAHLVRGKDVSLPGVVGVGEKFGFRREGPLSSIPLPELWPRHLPDTPAVRPMPAAQNEPHALRAGATLTPIIDEAERRERGAWTSI